MRFCDNAIKTKELNKRINSRYRRCFWTWPWGHCYCEWTDRSQVVRRCYHCGKAECDEGLYGK
ncbi:MAG: hypothetical protein A2104_00860 [Candidatus Melainabacteria bacterium GWF2_32_7]|nr:MAG: hypothetical protein A2104_00860 [Candidatus Melainabacteria bacterium GWF2_32_7]